MRAVLSLLAIVVFATGCMPGNASPAPTGPFVDYAKVAPPDNFVYLRSQRENLRVPALLVQACKGPNPKDFGEDYLSPILAEVTLLRMRDSGPGSKAIQSAVSGPNAVASPQGADACVAGLNWGRVANEISKVPELTGTPGTDDVPTCRKKNEGSWDVTMALLIRAWLLARDHFSPADRARLDTKVSRQAWLQGSAASRDQTICKPLPIPETENHQLLIETTRYLHNEWLPLLPPLGPYTTGKQVPAYVVDRNPDNAANGLRALLGGWLTTWRQSDFLEYNARPYTRYQMIGLLNLYDLARDESLRLAVRTVLDLLAAKAATESVGELRSPPFRRRAEEAGKPLFNSDTLPAMMQVWIGDLAPISRPEQAFTQEMTLAASSTYRPPDVLADLMLNPNHRSYLQSFNGRGQHELAYGSRDYVISGGGDATDCPYPTPPNPIISVHCKGSGNDLGTTQPIVLLPRRLREANPPGAQPLPTFTSAAIYSDTANTTCIGEGVACAPHLYEGTTEVKATPECRRDGTDPANGDTVHVLQMSKDCVTSATWPADSCFYIATRSFKTIGEVQPLAYLLSRECAGGLSFGAFADYSTTGQGRPLDRPPVGPSRCTTGPKNRAPCHAAWSTRIRPRPDGPLLTISVGPGPNYHLSPGAPSVGAASGPIAETTAARLALSDPAAGETLYDYNTGVLPAGDGQRDFTLTAGVDDRTSGNVDVSFSNVKYPDLVRDVTVTLVDQTQLGQECTVTLPDGSKACPDPRLCEIKGCPNVTQPTSLLSYTYYYRGTPFEAGTPVRRELTGPGVKLGHQYLVRACLTWWRFLSSSDYRADPYGVKDPADHETCENQLVLAHRYIPRLRLPLPPGFSIPPLPRIPQPPKLK